MPNRPICIFVVDDDPLLSMVISAQLLDNPYKIHEFSSGQQCLDALDLEPNLILLDIEMPDQNGLEVCREIRAQGHSEMNIIFVSAHDDMETLLAAFEAGGNDYIQKNAPKDLLLHKVKIAIEDEEKKRQLKQQLSYARETAFTAMSSLGETGIYLQLLRSTFQCLDLQEIGVALTDCLQQFGLKGLIRLTDEYEELDFGLEQSCTPLEQSILTYASKLGRICLTGNRLVFNYPNITLLIIGIDNEDEDGVGRLRDHLAIIAEGVGIRIVAMNTEQRRLREAQTRMESAKELADFVGGIEQSLHEIQQQMETNIEQYRQGIEAAFMHLGLTDSQEFLIQDLVDKLSAELNTLFLKEDDLAKRFNQMIAKQKKLLEQY
jgi:DNA-binding response OmpR family regulator